MFLMTHNFIQDKASLISFISTNRTCPQGISKCWPRTIIPGTFTYNPLTLLSYKRQNSLECQSVSDSFRKAIVYRALLPVCSTNNHGTVSEFNMALALLCEWPSPKAQSAINKPTGRGLKNGSLHWDCLSWFYPCKNVLMGTSPTWPAPCLQIW